MEPVVAKVLIKKLSYFFLALFKHLGQRRRLSEKEKRNVVFMELFFFYQLQGKSEQCKRDTCRPTRVYLYSFGDFYEGDMLPFFYDYINALWLKHNL
jgi:hypothetical protein